MGEIRKAGEECHNCVGGYANSSKLWIYRKDMIIAGVTVEDLTVYQCYDKHNTVTEESEAFRKELADLVRNSKNVKALETADSYLYA